jgi:hypothetical protein
VVSRRRRKGRRGREKKRGGREKRKERRGGTIIDSTPYCPDGMKFLLSKDHSATIEKWPYELAVW